LEAQKTLNTQGNTEQKRPTLELSQYLTSNHSNKNSMLRVQKTDAKTNGNDIE
jgi:hypothetical protein